MMTHSEGLISEPDDTGAGNSDVLTSWRQRLAAAAGLCLPVTLVFDRPTATSPARHLRAELLGLATDDGAVQPLGSADDEPIATVAMACRFPGEEHLPEQLCRDRPGPDRRRSASTGRTRPAGGGVQCDPGFRWRAARHPGGPVEATLGRLAAPAAFPVLMTSRPITSQGALSPNGTQRLRSR